MNFPKNFPKDIPNITFKNKIFHPYISSTGKLDLNVIIQITSENLPELEVLSVPSVTGHLHKAEDDFQRPTVLRRKELAKPRGR